MDREAIALKILREVMILADMHFITTFHLLTKEDVEEMRVKFQQKLTERIMKVLDKHLKIENC